MSKKIQRGLLAAGVLCVAGTAGAAGLDFSTLTASVDLTTVTAAILAVGALKVLPNVAIWGTKTILSMTKRS